ncbi:unnamed protein product [Hermetia illucens]|uniref:Uncharacterized protein n=1 Tax=Hermetia illucens TaxID=343691 RepID=A0A7R8V2V5_HERIL|nr:unnamed protein product [Hermetia illucens]
MSGILLKVEDEFTYEVRKYCKSIKADCELLLRSQKDESHQLNQTIKAGLADPAGTGTASQEARKKDKVSVALIG